MIKLVIFDFDGVFTNGEVLFDNNGNIIKRYNIKDGMGINLLKKMKIDIGVISGFIQNESQLSILKHLDIKYISFDCKDKLKVINEWCEKLNIVVSDTVAYMGDDINDLVCINEVKLSGCPKDAVPSVINNVCFISNKEGGAGCIREFCEYVLEYNKTARKEVDILDEIKKEFYYQITNFNIEKINNLAKIITSVQGNIYFSGVGKSGNAAKHCGDLLKCISFPSFYFDVLNSTHGDIGTMTNKDIILLFSNSGNTSEIVNIIPIFKNIGLKIIGICCNQTSKFKELCDETIVTPFNKEISGNINKIPTNSFMSHLIFSNILVSILKENITLDKYKENHLSGNIGKNLLKVKDCLITEYPYVILNNEPIDINEILLKMTVKKIGCCFFINQNNELIGILTDGDIRRKLLAKKNLNKIAFDDINTTYQCITDKDMFLCDLNIEKNIYIPVLENKKLIGIIN